MFIRHLILFNPVQFLASFAIKVLIKRLNLPGVILTLITTLFHTSYNLIGTVGIFPVIRILLDIRRWISRNATLPTISIPLLQAALSARHTPHLINSMLTAIGPLLNVCFPVQKGFMFVFDFFLVGIFSTFLKPIFKYVVKFIFGIVLSAIGVIWNESLSGIYYLKEFSLFIVDILEHYTGLKVPRVDDNSTGSILSVLGFVVVGIAGSIALIMLGDYYAHETMTKIPGVNTVVDSIHSIWHTITNYFHPSPVNTSTPINIPPQATEAISRTSSGDSTRTITLRDITPPVTRPSTPIPLPRSEDFNSGW